MLSFIHVPNFRATLKIYNPFTTSIGDTLSGELAVNQCRRTQNKQDTVVTKLKTTAIFTLRLRHF